MILRVVRFRLRPQVTEAETQEALTSFGNAVKSVPTIRHFHVGTRLDGIPGYKLDRTKSEKPTPDSATAGEYVAVFQFDNEVGLRTYLNHPAQKQMMEKFLALAETAEAADYKMLAGG